MALNQALSGINAAQADLNVIANNISNANTVGFKGSRAEFADIYAVTGLNLNATAVGGGTRLSDVAQQFTQGDTETTGNSLDMEINGNGFFVLNTGAGLAYTRAGDFKKLDDGTVVSNDGYKLQIYPPTGNGTFDMSTLTNLQLVTSQSTASATTNASIVANLPASASPPTVTPFNPTDVNSYNNATTFSVFDSQGGTHQATVYYVKTGTNTWDTHLYVDGQSADTTPPQQLTFDASGQIATPTTGNLAYNSINLGNGSNPLTLSLNFTNTTQFGTDYTPGTITKDGSEAGTLTNIDIDSSGVVTAHYSNTTSAVLGQVAVANFSNVQGLRQLGNTNWAASSDSGTAVMGTANTGQFGGIQSGQLESSNTADTTAQLVDMIQAQRAYQANAQVLSTDNTLASSLFNAVSR
ncbi:MAG TPA: flagellar hook protein FlgE [Dyella sp.]|uniref:flagellar hook protein FlgE n=1 Tax=Dyella sp. TaxID=1869338 RepID=UPI002F956164